MSSRRRTTVDSHSPPRLTVNFTDAKVSLDDHKSHVCLRSDLLGVPDYLPRGSQRELLSSNVRLSNFTHCLSSRPVPQCYTEL